LNENSGEERVVMTAENPQITVLIVEDDSISRSALAWLLKELGFQSLAVGDLASARKALAETPPPQIMILDLMLPDGNGVDLLAEVRQARLPVTVAVVTGITDELKLHEVTAWKPDAIFGKPVDVDDFDDWLVKQLSSFALTSSRGTMNEKAAPPQTSNAQT
jgi:DNA-binding response OmpR family regulator